MFSDKHKIGYRSRNECLLALLVLKVNCPVGLQLISQLADMYALFYLTTLCQLFKLHWNICTRGAYKSLALQRKQQATATVKMYLLYIFPPEPHTLMTSLF
jgi:hypothetical protein